MSKAQHLLEQSRRSSTGSVTPTLELPRIPDQLKRTSVERQAWERFELALDAWRKTLLSHVSVVSRGAPSQATTISQPSVSEPEVAESPFTQASLKSLYLFEWTMS